MKKEHLQSVILMAFIAGFFNANALAIINKPNAEIMATPTVITMAATMINTTTAIIGGKVTADGGSPVIERGVIYGTETNPLVTDVKVVLGSGLGNFSVTLTGLDPAKTFYYVAFATNSSGTSYGIERSFPLCPSMAVDADGNIYNTVNFGSQCWLKENLKTTRYRNGTPIPNLSNNVQWANDLIGVYAWYDNDISWKDKYCALYNWYAATNANELCPQGWKVPSMDDMMIAYSILGGGIELAGKQVKSCRTVNSPLGGACSTSIHPRWEYDGEHYGIDLFGAAVLPSGMRYMNGLYALLGYSALFWSATQQGELIARYGIVDYNFSDADGGAISKKNGFSIRCLREVNTCNEPTDLQATTHPNGTATLQWVRTGIETAWNIEYGPKGYTQGTGTSVQIVVNNPYTLTGLSPYIVYDAYVQALCGQMISSWVGPVTFSITSMPGDANCNGEVNVLDIITMINHIMLQNPSPFCFGNADINGDNAVNVLDVIGVVNIIMSGGSY